MALPEKDYFTFEDLADRWKARLRDVRYYAEHGLIDVQIWIEDCIVEPLLIRIIDGDMAYIREDRVPLRGYVLLGVDDIRRAFKEGKVEIREFKADNRSCLYKIPAHLPAVVLDLGELVIHRVARDSFEREYKVDISQSNDQALSAARSASFPGRPSVMNRVIGKFNERAGSGETIPTLMGESKYLRDWISQNEPNQQAPTERTIANALRSHYRAAAENQAGILPSAVSHA